MILSVPPWIAKDLLPGLTTPDEFRGILNVHFQIAPPRGQPAILGVVNAEIEWLFAFPDRLSVTISNADRLIDRPRDELAAEIWREAAALTGLPADLPPWQIVKEKRATFAATPAQNAKRPDSRTRWANVVLAGDWIQTGLPATIEGAVRSGYKAASIVVGSGADAPRRRAHEPFAMNIALDHSQDPPSPEALERHISRAAKALLARQHEDGHWCFELEADATIPAEYVLLRHFRGEKPDLELERLIAVYLRRIQGDHGGWPLVHAGPFDMSASVKAYFALKMIGDDPEAPHMAPRARSDPRPWRRGEEQCLHALPARALRGHSLARRADHAGRDHAPAALVSLPYRQGFLLGAHGDGAAAGAASAEAAARQSARRHDPGAVRRAARNCARVAKGRASGMG